MMLLAWLIVVQAFLGNAQDSNFHIYLCFGQSNMAGAGDIEAQDRTVDSRFQFMKPQDCSAQNQYAGNWYPAVPPLWGCSGGIGPADYFGRTMVENLPDNVRVGVVVVGVPGCKIELFGKTGFDGLDTYNNVPAQYNGSAYAWLLDLARNAQQDGVIKGFLVHQGESNTGDSDWPEKVKNVYDNLIVDLGLNSEETPLLAGELLYQSEGGACWSHNTIIANLPNVLPNSYVISASDLPGKDQYHFNSEGNRTFGTRYAEQMLALMPNGPAVVLASPSQNANYSVNSPIELIAEAGYEQGALEKVEFFDGSSKLGEVYEAPFIFVWNDASVGTHSLSAVAIGTDGESSNSTLVSIKVNEAQAPYGAVTPAIPGTIQFENFDVGGNGFAYYDTDVGTNVDPAPNYRFDEDVDIEVCEDAGGGYNLGWTAAGEWTEYTVNVETAGAYLIEIRVACDGDDRTIDLSMDGISLAGNITIPNTGGWQAWETIEVPSVELQAGEQVLRLTVGESDYVNLNYIVFNQYDLPNAAIRLNEGWNIISYPLEKTVTLEVALQSILDKVLLVKNLDSFWDASNPSFLNSLTQMEWSKGYLVYVSANCELYFN